VGETLRSGRTCNRRLASQSGPRHVHTLNCTYHNLVTSFVAAERSYVRDSPAHHRGHAQGVGHRLGHGRSHPRSPLQYWVDHRRWKESLFTGGRRVRALDAEESVSFARWSETRERKITYGIELLHEIPYVIQWCVYLAVFDAIHADGLVCQTWSDSFDLRGFQATHMCTWPQRLTAIQRGWTLANYLRQNENSQMLRTLRVVLAYRSPSIPHILHVYAIHLQLVM
jgi:hypothetical protein